LANRKGKTGKSTPSRSGTSSTSSKKSTSSTSTGKTGKTGKSTPSRSGTSSTSSSSSSGWNSFRTQGTGAHVNPVKTWTGMTKPRVNTDTGISDATKKAQQALSDKYGITTYDVTGRISTTPKKSSTTFTNILHGDITGFTEKTKTEIAKQKKEAEVTRTKKIQQELSDTYGITTYDTSGNISTTPKTLAKHWKDSSVVQNVLVGEANQTLREQVEAKNQATQEFREKWHGIRENGVLVQEPTATRTDALQALLTSNNEHFGTDTRNLEQYLTERDYDISAIIAGETTVPDDIFEPKKQTTYRELSKQLTSKLDRISNYETAKGKNAVQRNVSYAGIKGEQYIQLKKEVEIIQEQLQSPSIETLKTESEDIIRDVVAKTYGVSDTPQNVARTTKGTTPKKEVSTPVHTTTFLPQILILAAGVLGVILLWRKLK
jgi:hypothetical protein